MFDLEEEICKAETLMKNAVNELFEANEIICKKIDIDFPARNVVLLRSTIDKITKLEPLLYELKEQLVYIHENELKFI